MAFRVSSLAVEDPGFGFGLKALGFLGKERKKICQRGQLESLTGRSLEHQEATLSFRTRGLERYRLRVEGMFRV